MKEEDDVYLLALTIYHEARGEDYDGKIAVGSVALNRLDTKRWGSTLNEVIYAPAQFSWTLKKNLSITEREIFEECLEIAKGLLDKSIPRNTDALFYHSKKVNPFWARKMKLVDIIGNHIFYKDVEG